MATPVPKLQAPAVGGCGSGKYLERSARRNYHHYKISTDICIHLPEKASMRHGLGIALGIRVRIRNYHVIRSERADHQR